MRGNLQRESPIPDGPSASVTREKLLSKAGEYSHASLNDGDALWEMRRYAISSLCERHTVYLHKPRYYSIAYYTPRLYGTAYCS